MYQKLAEKDLYPLLLEMGNSREAINKFQQKRILISVIVPLLSIIGLLFYHSIWILVAGIVLSGILWWTKYKGVKQAYQLYKFNLQLEFSKFMRLMIPYLLQNERSLYGTFNAMHERSESQRIKAGLQVLMVEMGDSPNLVDPYIKFAKECSGTDSSNLFMTTIYDFQQSSFDTSVIEELGQLASEELFNTLDEVIAFKLKKFGMFPSKLTMVTFIITVGYMISMVFDTIKTINF